MEMHQEIGEHSILPSHRFPQNQEEADIAERELSKQLDELSLNEHESYLFDIHGISHITEADPARMHAKLKEMHEVIRNLEPSKTEAFLEAQGINPNYTSKYLETFLTVEKLDVFSAVGKAMQHFDVKRELFGNGAVLARDIRQSDLSSGARAVLEYGHMQIAQFRDSSGRAVVFLNSDYNREGFDQKDLGQSIFYFGETFFCDDDTTKHGMVWVFYNMNNISVEKDDLGPVYRVEKSLPSRIVALHYAYSSESLRPYVTGMQLYLEKSDRFRVRPHMGTLAEVTFSLQTYGIPIEASPMSGDGVWDRTKHLESIQAQRLREEHEERLLSEVERDEDKKALHDRIGIPRRFDVILGKSSEARSHPGNRRAAYICEMKFPSYNKASKLEKMKITDEVLHMIRASGGRFLKWEEEGWSEELDEVLMKRKVAHFFRYIRSKVKSGGDDKPELDNLDAYIEASWNATSSTKRVTPSTSPLDDESDDRPLVRARGSSAVDI